MKKFSESVIGIILLAVIPASVAYLTLFLWLKTYITMKQHLPFIISMGVFILTALILWFRSWLLDKFKKTGSSIEGIKSDIGENYAILNDNFYDFNVMIKLLNLITRYNLDMRSLTGVEVKYYKEFLTEDDMKYLGFTDDQIKSTHPVDMTDILQKVVKELQEVKQKLTISKS
jgi:hypothetical protein